MGVKGLWQLLEPVGRPVTLESLENKILGVDASVILNQSVKGMRDRHGNPIPNAHLVGLFNRVCKLLYYRIKPVFVFDGGVPHLKKKTLALRKERRFKAIHGSKIAAERIAKNFLKAKALETVTGKKSTSTIRSKSPREPDVFELSPLPAGSNSENISVSEDEDMDRPILEQFHNQHLEETFQNPSTIDIDSEDFKTLPPEIQHELIKEMKEERKWMNNSGIFKYGSDFASFQLEGVLKRGKMNQRLDELRKEMNKRNSGELAGLSSHESLTGNSTVLSQKILSEDTAHYILIKGNDQMQEQNKQEISTEASSKDFSSEGGFFQKEPECEVISWTLPRPEPRSSTNAPFFDIPDVSSSDSEPLTPFVDVPEAYLSPTSSQEKHSLFQFTPVNQRGSCSETSAERVGREPRKQIFEDCIVISPDGKRKISVESKMEKEVEPGLVCVDAGSASEDGLLTQIIDKKKELDNLIKKWAESREQKQNNLSHIELDIQHRTVVDIKELLEDSKGSLTSKQADKNSDKQQLSSISVDETENTTLGSTYSKKTPITNPLTTETTETEEISEHVTGANKSNLESCSVEEVPSFSEQSSSGVVEHCRSSDQRRQAEADTVTSESEVEMKEPTEDKPDTLEAYSVDRDNMVTVLPESKLDEPPDKTVISIIDTTHSPDTNQADVNCVEDLKISQEQFPGGKEWSITEDEDQAEMHNIQVTQESGPSSLPSEWQGASLEDLEEIQCDIESEQISLASEQSRQNRIAVTVSNEMYSECQELLQLFGVPYLVSPMEAEAQCAALDVLNLTQGSVTDDSDIFLFGGRRVYKNIFNQNKHAEMYGSDAVQTILALSRTNLICLAFITGSDYTEGIPGVGVVGAMEIIHEFSGEGLEGLKKFKLWHQQAQKQTKSPQETKLKRKLRSVTLPVGFASDEVFEAYLNPVVDQSTERFEWGKPDLHALRLFASDKFGWPSSRTDELLLPVLKQLNRDQTQMKINQFFEVKFQEARAIKSKRLRRVLNLKLNPSSSNDGGDETGERKKNSRRMEGNEVLHEKTEGKRVHERGSASSGSRARKDSDSGSEAKQPRRRKQEVNAMAEASGANRERAWGRTRKTLPQRGAGGNVTTDLEATILLTPVKLSDNLYGSQLLAESGGKSPGGPSDPCVQTTSSTAYDGREADDSPSNSNRNVEAATRTRRKRPSSDEHITNPKRGHRARSGFRHARTRRVAERTPEDSTSDSSLDDEDCGKYYDGPRPVFVFRRGGRQRARSRRGRGR